MLAILWRRKKKKIKSCSVAIFLWKWRLRNFTLILPDLWVPRAHRHTANALTADNIQSRAALDKIFTFSISSLDCTWNDVWLNSSWAPPPNWPCLALADQQQQKQDAWTCFHMSTYVSFSPFYRGRKKKCKGKSSWSNLPGSQLGHHQGWDTVTILRYRKADNLQVSAFSSRQYFKYLQSHVPFWGIADIRAFYTRIVVQKRKCYQEGTEHFPHSPKSG